MSKTLVILEYPCGHSKKYSYPCDIEQEIVNGEKPYHATIIGATSEELESILECKVLHPIHGSIRQFELIRGEKDDC